MNCTYFFGVKLSPPEAASSQGGPTFNRIICSKALLWQ